MCLRAAFVLEAICGEISGDDELIRSRGHRQDLLLVDHDGSVSLLVS
jgi:hypothetical protein